MFIIQLIGMWLLFLGIAIVNGGIREKYLQNYMEELLAHQLSTMLLTAGIFLFTAIFVKFKHITDKKTLFFTGIFWSSLTIVFEFLFFHFIGGKPMAILLADYNLLKGRLFSLVIISTLFSPIISSLLFIKTQQ